MEHNADQGVIEEVICTPNEIRVMQIPESLRKRIEKMKTAGNDLSGAAVRHVDHQDDAHRDFYSDRG